MPHSYDEQNLAQVGVGTLDPKANTRSGVAVLGLLGGRLVKYSIHRGGPTPPAHVTTRAVIREYYDGSDGGHPYIEARSTDIDGNPVYFGAGSDLIAVGGQAHDKWWTASDWSRGLTIWIHDANRDPSVPASGAAGQYAFAWNRPPDNPNRFLLRAPLAIAPQVGDEFIIGGQLAWVTFASRAAPPLGGWVSPRRFEVILRPRDGTAAPRLEFYPSGEGYVPDKPTTPFQSDRVFADLDASARERRGVLSASLADDQARGCAGHEIAPALAEIVEKGNDYLIDEVTVEYVENQ